MHACSTFQTCNSDINGVFCFIKLTSVKDEQNNGLVFILPSINVIWKQNQATIACMCIKFIY